MVVRRYKSDFHDQASLHPVYGDGIGARLTLFALHFFMVDHHIARNNPVHYLTVQVWGAGKHSAIPFAQLVASLVGQYAWLPVYLYCVAERFYKCINIPVVVTFQLQFYRLNNCWRVLTLS